MPIKTRPHATQSVPVQGEARLAFWCLSRQQFPPAVIGQHIVPLLDVVALGLVTGNKWESMQCVQQALKCIAALVRQTPAGLQAQAHLWLPLLWRLLLVQPVTEYEQVCQHLQLHLACALSSPGPAHACD